MAQTKQYQYLCKRYKELKRALLPSKLSLTGNYQNTTFEKVSAFKLLTHAELEYYFEEIALTIAKDAYEKWKKNNIASPALVALLAYCKKDFPAIPESTNDQKSKKGLDERIQDAYTQYNSYVRSNNHGIKEKNMLALFLPIGVKKDQIDNSLLIALDNYGAARGIIAHSTKAKQQSSPSDANQAIKDLIALIASFDTTIKNKYKLK